MCVMLPGNVALGFSHLQMCVALAPGLLLSVQTMRQRAALRLWATALT